MKLLKRYILDTANAELARYVTNQFEPSGLSYKELLGTKNGYSTLLGNSTKWENDFGDYWVTGMYLAPHSEVKGLQLCWGRGSCVRSCLIYTGHNGVRPTNHMKRDMHISERRTRALFEHTEMFLTRLIAQIMMMSNQRDCLMIRLNGTSDIRWEYILDLKKMSEDFGCKFFDYTKLPLSKRQPIDDVYRLCYSYDEKKVSWERATEYIESGYPVAIVLTKDDYKKVLGWSNPHIIDGDAHDIRYFDSGICVLKYKRPSGKYAQSPNEEFIQNVGVVSNLAYKKLCVDHSKKYGVLV